MILDGRQQINHGPRSHLATLPGRCKSNLRRLKCLVGRFKTGATLFCRLTNVLSTFNIIWSRRSCNWKRTASARAPCTGHRSTYFSAKINGKVHHQSDPGLFGFYAGHEIPFAVSISGIQIQIRPAGTAGDPDLFFRRLELFPGLHEHRLTALGRFKPGSDPGGIRPFC